MIEVTRYIAADRATVYQALLDSDAIAAWRAPNGMTAVVHTLDARVGGQFRVSLTYASPARRGKSTAHTDTYHGHFIELVPNDRGLVPQHRCDRVSAERSHMRRQSRDKPGSRHPQPQNRPEPDDRFDAGHA